MNPNFEIILHALLEGRWYIGKKNHRIVGFKKDHFKIWIYISSYTCKLIIWQDITQCFHRLVHPQFARPLKSKSD